MYFCLHSFLLPTVMKENNNKLALQAFFINHFPFALFYLSA